MVNHGILHRYLEYLGIPADIPISKGIRLGFRDYSEVVDNVHVRIKKRTQGTQEGNRRESFHIRQWGLSVLTSQLFFILHFILFHLTSLLLPRRVTGWGYESRFLFLEVWLCHPNTHTQCHGHRFHCRGSLQKNKVDLICEDNSTRWKWKLVCSS
jgi:hypothetical protein